MNTTVCRSVLLYTLLALSGIPALGGSPANPHPEIQEARRLMEQGDYDLGVPLLQRLASGEGKTAGEAFLLLGSYYKSVEEDEYSAIAAYRQGLQKLGDYRGKVYFDTQTALASALVVAEDADGALNILDSLAKEYGGPTPEWSYWRGRCYLLKGNKEQAYGLFKEVISEHPRNPIALNASLNLGRSLIEEGRKAEGLAVLDEYQAAHPGTEPQIIMWKGIYLFDGKHYTEAIPALQTALKNPRYSANAGLIRNLSLALCRVGRITEGMQLARRVVDNQTGDRLAGAYNWLGNTYLREARNCREAIRAHTSALKVKGISPESRGYTMLRLVISHSSAGDTGRALACFRKLVAEQGADSTWARRANEWLTASPPAE